MICIRRSNRDVRKEILMQLYRKIAIAALLILTMLTVQGRSALAASDISPVQLVKSRNEAVDKILASAGDNIAQSTKEKLKDIINGFIDFRELSRLALGKHWKARTEQEKKDFTNVFQQLIRNSSVKKLEIYKADRIEYEAPKISGKIAKVNTIAYKGRKQVEVLYKMHQVGGGWKVFDMEIDGVSTALNYRGSFYKQIAKTSYKEMYDKLVARLAEK